MAVLIRPARERDLAACYDAWLSTESEHLAESGTAPPAGTVLPLHEHELHTGRLVVAESDGTVVGFGATLTRSDVLYLADLFVRPEYQGRGVGRALLHELLDDAPARRFTFASTDPSARALYAKFGMEQQWALHHLELDGSVELDTDGVVAVAAAFEDIVALDGRLTGRDRRRDLEHERDRLGFTCMALERRGNVIGYGVVIHPQWWVPWNPNGTRVAPVIVADPGDACGAVAATVMAALEIGATSIRTFVPEPHPALATLEAAGFERTDEDAYMTSDPALIPATRYLPPIDTP